MTHPLIRGLYLWAGALALALTVIVPMAMPWRLALVVAVAVLVTTAWARIERQRTRVRQPGASEELDAALSSVQRQPVVLVCGYSQRLFGVTAETSPVVRFTAQGCYVHVHDVTQLPLTVERVLARYPDWIRQLSVMLAVSPLEHTDQGDLVAEIRATCHQLSLARRSGAPLPLQLVTYLPGVSADEAWFSWESGQALVSVRQAGACLSLADWQRRANDEVQRGERLQACIQLNSASHWLAEVVLPHLSVREGIVASSITFLPDMHVSNANLWHQWLAQRTALDGTRPKAAESRERLPLPDPLLALLPLSDRHAAARLIGVAALWMFTATALTAFASSAWQNTKLLRQITHDLTHYASLAPVQRRDQSGFVQREDAVKVLQRHAARLEDYYRHGEPLSLGLGLYQGERLRAPLLNAIASYRPPLPEKAALALDPVRLDSLSLFGVGSAQLKPGSTKVLIQALQHIKAQPGWLIVITGHTDATGSDDHNLQLSRARAAAVRDWMQRMGDLHDSCFAVQGVGARQPIASNDLEGGRSANRRVDIRLVPEAGACVPPQTVPGVEHPAA